MKLDAKLFEKKIDPHNGNILVYKPDEIDELLKLGDPFIKTIFETGRILYG